MKTFFTLAILLFSINVSAQNVQYANIVSVTPITDQVAVIKQQCNQNGYQQEHSYVGAIIGGITGALVGRTVGKGNGNIIATAGGAIGGTMIGDVIDNSPSQTGQCRNLTTYEPTPGGYQIVYELNGQQYTTRSRTFPRGKHLAVEMSPTPVYQTQYITRE